MTKLLAIASMIKKIFTKAISLPATAKKLMVRGNRWSLSLRTRHPRNTFSKSVQIATAVRSDRGDVIDQTIHILKTWPEYFEAVYNGSKTTEIREDDNRDFRAGDLLRLNEWNPRLRVYTGRSVYVSVNHVMEIDVIGYGELTPCVCVVMSIAKIN
jgi:hypothetical protein